MKLTRSLTKTLSFALVVASILACGKESDSGGNTAVSDPPIPIALFSPRITPLSTGEMDRISQIDVLFFTYLRSNPGTVAIRVVDGQGKTLREAAARSESLKDGAFYAFRLDPPIKEVRGKNLSLEVSFQGKGKESMVAVQGPVDPERRGFTHRVK